MEGEREVEGAREDARERERERGRKHGMTGDSKNLTCFTHLSRRVRECGTLILRLHSSVH